MIDFNAAEILVLVVLAVIIFGPDKLPELARKLARVFNYLRVVANDARGQLREQLGPEFDDIHLSDLNPRNLGAKLLGEDAAHDLASAGRTATEAAAAVTSTLRAEAGGESQPGRTDASAADLEPASSQPRLIAFDPEAT